MISSPLFCDTCGAANRPQATFCSACGLRLHTAAKSTISNTLTGLLVQRHMLNGRYRIMAQIGKGGFGAVYKAEDIYFGNRTVAVKEMSQSNLSAQELAEATRAFKQEAMLLASLKHPNLPSIYDQFNDSGRWYLVMDFIEGETLESRLEKVNGNRLQVGMALIIAIQACSVLDYLHSRQPPIIFRDLKPANIMLTPAGHLYLIDFGIARHFKPGQTKDTSALGSSGYAAPEQYGKAQTTPRADLYGLGATLHQMLTGDDPSQSPFHFAPLRQRGLPGNATVTRLEALVSQLIEMDVNKRPASALLVRQTLLNVVGHSQPLAAAASTNPLSASLSTGIGIPAGYQPPVPLAPPRPVSPAPVPPMPPIPLAPAASAAPKRSRPAPVQPQQNTLFICRGHKSRVTALAWSPDGKQLASASFDKLVRLWDGANGNSLFIYRGHAAHINALAWSPDGRRVASASDDGTVQVWEAPGGNLLFTYRGHSAAVTALAWSPDGLQLASGGEDKTVQVWRVNSTTPTNTFKGHTEKINALAWSPDGRRIASGGVDKKVLVWEAGKEYRSGLLSYLIPSSRNQLTYSGHTGIITSLAWSRDGRRIASTSADRTVQVWDALSGKRGFLNRNRSASVNAVSWSPDSRHLAFGSNDKTVQVWDALSNKFITTYLGHIKSVTAVCWSPFPDRVASAGVDYTIQVWRVK